MSRQKSKWRKLQRENVSFKSDGRCWYCGVLPTKPMTLDHQISRIDGGSNGIENLVLCCPSCNSRKNKMGLEAFRRRNRFYEIDAPYFSEKQEEWLARKGFYLDEIVPNYNFFGEIVAAERPKGEVGDE